ncbi:PREDICTED: synaptobrevin homolog YKT6 [Tinamus guttatus]|uniref:synaptobrevin homolog YKT6 n=1 Tax=Tinamus guttatus TaxID=94827 RepID=UPI00052EF1E7|nr:PREDICTED: synaptobrevin homolog YKT6 [Tinamus guttatus]
MGTQHPDGDVAPRKAPQCHSGGPTPRRVPKVSPTEVPPRKPRLGPSKRAWRGENPSGRPWSRRFPVLQVLDEFSRQVSKMDWPSGSPATVGYAALDGYLSTYQNPREADPMTRVQAELDETKIILHNTMESLLERGEKLDDLVSKSEVLGAQSKAFYKTARKQNSCCKIM